MTGAICIIIYVTLLTIAVTIIDVKNYVVERTHIECVEDNSTLEDE